MRPFNGMPHNKSACHLIPAPPSLPDPAGEAASSATNDIPPEYLVHVRQLDLRQTLQRLDRVFLIIVVVI